MGPAWTLGVPHSPKTFMPPPPTIERRLSDGQQGTVTIALLVSLGAAIIISLLVVTLIVLRKRKNQSENIPYGVPLPRTHKSKVKSKTSDTNLSLEGDLNRVEKPIHVALHFTDENAHNISLNNPNKLYRAPSSQTLPLFPPMLSSYCLAQNIDPISDHPNERLPFPSLPPLIIPNDPRYSQVGNPAVDEESSPTQLSSRSSSSPSLYSQQTAESAPEYVEIPLNPRFTHEERRKTLLVSALLKARAQRNPNGLVRRDSRVSHIERSESIKSVASIHHHNRPFSKRYHSKKRKVPHSGEMGLVKEVLVTSGLHGSSESLTRARWERGTLVQVPPRVDISASLNS